MRILVAAVLALLCGAGPAAACDRPPGDVTGDRTADVVLGRPDAADVVVARRGAPRTLASGPAGSQFGASVVALRCGRLLVGAPGAGAVYLVSRGHARVIARGTGFGTALAAGLHGKRVELWIGAPGRVVHRTLGRRGHQTLRGGGGFGTVLAATPAGALAGAPDDGGGAVEVLRLRNGRAVRGARLTLPGGQPGDRFGASLAASDSYPYGSPRLAGAPGADGGAGAVAVIRGGRVARVLRQSDPWIAGEATSGAHFGTAVSTARSLRNGEDLEFVIATATALVTVDTSSHREPGLGREIPFAGTERLGMLRFIDGFDEDTADGYVATAGERVTAYGAGEPTEDQAGATFTVGGGPLVPAIPLTYMAG